MTSISNATLKAYVALRSAASSASQPRRGATFIEYMLLVVIAIIIFGVLLELTNGGISQVISDVGDKLRQR